MEPTFAARVLKCSLKERSNGCLLVTLIDHLGISTFLEEGREPSHSNWIWTFCWHNGGKHRAAGVKTSDQYSGFLLIPLISKEAVISHQQWCRLLRVQSSMLAIGSSGSNTMSAPTAVGCESSCEQQFLWLWGTLELVDILPVVQQYLLQRPAHLTQ